KLACFHRSRSITRCDTAVLPKMSQVWHILEAKGSRTCRPFENLRFPPKCAGGDKECGHTPTSKAQHCPKLHTSPVERVTQLIEESSSMRGYGMAILKSSNLEAFFERTLDDLECEYIYPPAVFEELLSWDPERVAAAAKRPNYTVFLHDDLPIGERCGICLFDERVSICCYDPDTEAVRGVVDSAAPEVRRWAESVHERYLAEARPLEVAEESASRRSLERV
ncbi:hypothetical protein, partial [Marinospirillum sp.]|uniref:transcriptional regulator FilR1 domain-containing protein n=1 Tax=Marinospirillum sp. TaxID=2183934 RepID=UPI003A8C0C87